MAILHADTNITAYYIMEVLPFSWALLSLAP
jgi:hypothetical protein